jgi:hypothetical protein
MNRPKAMSEFENIQRLIRLKRHERPSEDFVEQFVADFQQRQRAELLRHSARGLLWERVTTYFEGLLNPKWAWAGATAMAVVGFGFMMKPGSGGPAQQVAANKSVAIQVATRNIQQVSYAPSARERAAFNAEIEQILISNHYNGGLGDERMNGREQRPNSLSQSQLYPNGFYVDLSESGMPR